jgi:hypothetical protein
MFSGAKFSDDFDRPLALLFGIGDRVRLEHDIDGAPYQLGDGYVAREGNSPDSLCLFLGDLDLCSDHGTSSDYTSDEMITNGAMAINISGMRVVRCESRTAHPESRITNSDIS